MRNISEVEAAYIAGFFDGEGCIHAVGNGRRRIVITFAQRHAGILSYIHRTLGIGKLITHKSKRWGVSYRYRIDTMGEAEEFIRAILPYSILKRRQLELGLEYIGTGSWKGRQVPESVQSERRRIAREMKELKKIDPLGMS